MSIDFNENVCECCGQLIKKYNFYSMLTEVRPILISAVQKSPHKFSQKASQEILSNDMVIKWRNEFLWPIINHHLNIENLSTECLKTIRRIFVSHVEKNTMEAIDVLTEEEGKFEPELIESKIPKRNNKEKIILLTSIYNEKDFSRFNELKTSLHKNIKNEFIDRIVLFIDNRGEFLNKKGDPSKELISFLEKLQIPKDFRKKIDISVNKNRFNYQQAINYTKKFGEDDAVYLLSNSDCYFDETINLIKKIDYKNKILLSMTRQDQLADGTIVNSRRTPSKKTIGDFMITKELSNSPRMPPLSSDAWVFTKKTADSIKTNFSRLELGRLHCEQQFLSALKLEGLELYNVGFHGFIRCIHLHNSGLRYVAQNEPIILDPKKSLRLPYRMRGDNMSWNRIVKDSEWIVDNLINGTCIAFDPSNYLFDNLYEEKFGSYVVRRLEKLFKYH